MIAESLWLASDALDRMIEEARRVEPLESGGVLLGWREAGGSGAVVAGIIGPGPRAVHKRARFSPDSGWQRTEIARAYDASERRLSYLGDWHSHPAGGTTPSLRDEKTARRIGRSRAARVAHPVMIIVAGKETSWDPAPFLLVERRLRRVTLYPTRRLVDRDWKVLLPSPSEDEILTGDG